MKAISLETRKFWLIFCGVMSFMRANRQNQSRQIQSQVTLPLLSFLLLILLLSLPNFAQAQSKPRPLSAKTRTADQQLRTNPKLQKPIENSDFDFSGSFVVDTSSSINTAESRSYSGSYALGMGVSYKPESISLNLRGAYNHEYSYEDDHGKTGDWDNLGYTLMKSIKKPTSFLNTFSYGLGGGLPLGDEARRQGFKGSIGPRLEADTKIGDLTIADTLLYAYRVYAYDIRDDGTINAPHSYSDTISMSYAITKSLQISTEFTYQYVVSFQQVGKAYYSDSLALGYDVTSKLNLSGGVGTANHEMLEADGMTYRVKPIDPEKSQLFLDLAMKI